LGLDEIRDSLIGDENVRGISGERVWRSAQVVDAVTADGPHERPVALMAPLQAASASA